MSGAVFERFRPMEIEPKSTDTSTNVGGSSVFTVELSLAVASALERLTPEQRKAAPRYA